MLYEPSAGSTRLPSSSLAYITDQPEESTAYDAYLTLNSLLAYRAEHQGGLPFLCPIDVDNGTCNEYSIAYCAKLVRDCAEHLCDVGRLSPRCGGHGGKVVAMMGMSWMDYWVHKMAVTKL